ncbi:MAG TPA: hypothetical protein PKA63_07010 [Oligoflexia bacterium]|mgnify:CR=1 FL=1|nr:hypothetical protein [Oligoflexia bacterium]HMP48400.1 hypothetical protein [Oligoflexia bacterium]
MVVEKLHSLMIADSDHRIDIMVRIVAILKTVHEQGETDLLSDNFIKEVKKLGKSDQVSLLKNSSGREKFLILILFEENEILSPFEIQTIIDQQILAQKIKSPEDISLKIYHKLLRRTALRFSQKRLDEMSLMS